MTLRYRLVWAEGACAAPVSGTVVDATGFRGRTRIDFGDVRVAEVIGNLNVFDISELELYRLAATLGGASLETAIQRGLTALKGVQALVYDVYWQRRFVARVFPLTGRPFWDREVAIRGETIVLGPHAYLRPVGRGLMVLAPASNGEVFVDGWLASEFLLQSWGGVVRDSATSAMLSLLLEVLTETGHLWTAESAEFGLMWSFSDLVFHATSRLGAYWGNFGKRPQGVYPAPDGNGQKMGLLIDLNQEEGRPNGPCPTLQEALARRRSERRPGPRSLTLAQLSAFLALAAKPMRRGGSHELLHYPYPSGGGIYRYHIYVVIHRCSGLQQGLYRYQDESHGFRKLTASRGQTELLAAHCGGALGIAEKPDSVLVVTAEVAPFTLAYDAIAYRLILLGAGCLLQNMYLAAAALGLAGSAAGASNAALFAEASDASPASEPSLAEFALSGSAMM